jgi:hypothetical protein
MIRQAQTTSNKQRAADLIVLLLLGGAVGYYCYDAIRASTDILNLILVLPVALVVLGLCAIQFFFSIRGVRPAEAEAATDILPVVILFALYVLSLDWLGFDIGTCLFIGAFLWLNGERRLPWLLAYPIAFAFVLTVFFSLMLPYPMPMLLLGSVQ